MQRSQLTTAQLAARKNFLDMLATRGWSVPEGWDLLFASDADLTPEAIAEYDNGSMILQLSLDISENLLRLHCGDAAREVIFRLIPRESIDDVVEAITKIRDQVTMPTYPLLVKASLEVCKDVYLETPDELIRLERSE